MILTVLADAAAATPPTGTWQAFIGSPMAMMVFMVFIFYFLMIRPQQQQQKKHKAMIENLKKGDEVITRSGFIGTIYGIADGIITLELSDNVRVKMLKDQIASLKTA